MNFMSWLALIGAVLLLTAMSGAVLRRLPFSNAMLFMGLGVALGPVGFGLIRIDPIADSNWLERVMEIVVIVSLFVGGLKLRLPVQHAAWQAAYRLAGPIMLLSIAGVALFGFGVLGLTPAAALLLGAVLAPTDPVLASEVTVSSAKDRDRMRYALSGEAGLNDGAAFPFVVLALLLVENQGQLGGWLGGWALEKLIWAIPVGLLLGYALGWGFGRLAIVLRQRSAHAGAGNDLLVLALVLLAYSLTEFVHGWGFLAAFTAGLGLRRAEVVASQQEPAPVISSDANINPNHTPSELLLEHDLEREAADHPAVASGLVVRDVLTFGETLERLMSVFVTVIVGVLVSTQWDWRGVGLAAVLFLVIRPVASAIGLIGAPLHSRQKLMVAWFGLRGIGTLYYLAYAIGEGVGRERGTELWRLALTVVACSIVVHGVSVTPLLDAYERAVERRKERAARGREAKV